VRVRVKNRAAAGEGVWTTLLLATLSVYHNCDE